MPAARTADPYRDLAVIDARAPRFNQSIVALAAVIGAATGSWVPFLVLGAQMSLGLVFGRRFCLPCVAYFEWVQPRLGEGPLEDARAPRFANILGAFFLNGAALAYLLGAPRLGLGLAVTLAFLATLAATTGLCVGCELYRIVARLRGLRETTIDRVDLAELGIAADDEELVVQFLHPLCTGCQELEDKLRKDGRRVVPVDVSKRRDLARKYGITLVPIALRVTGDGTVLGPAR